MIIGHSEHELRTKKHVVLPKKIVTGHPYHSHLSKTATFFCPQGGRCGDCWTLNNAIVFGPFFPFYLNQKKKKRN